MQDQRSASERERSMSASILAHRSWARTKDRSARTAPARRALLERFELEVDPHGEMTPADRAAAAENARRAHYRTLALASARARRARRAGDSDAGQVAA